MSVKLRIKESNDALGTWWTCYNPMDTNEIFKLIGMGKTPRQAYINYLKPAGSYSGIPIINDRSC